MVPKFRAWDKKTKEYFHISELWNSGTNPECFNFDGWTDIDTAFTGAEYILFKRDHPEWVPFLPVYDINNTAIFIPVKDGDEE